MYEDFCNIPKNLKWNANLHVQAHEKDDFKTRAQNVTKIIQNLALLKGDIPPKNFSVKNLNIKNPYLKEMKQINIELFAVINFLDDPFETPNAGVYTINVPSMWLMFPDEVCKNPQETPFDSLLIESVKNSLLLIDKSNAYKEPTGLKKIASKEIWGIGQQLNKASPENRSYALVFTVLHELSHIQKKDVLKKPSIIQESIKKGLFYGISLGALSGFGMYSSFNSYGLLTGLVVGLLIGVRTMVISGSKAACNIEEEADQFAMELPQLNKKSEELFNESDPKNLQKFSVQGGIALFKAAIASGKSVGNQNIFHSKEGNFIIDIIHPSYSKRLDYLEKKKEELEKN